jgi:hypothetical protein
MSDTNNKPQFLELFSGTHSVGRVATRLGYEVTSLDLSNATINIDILEWDYKAAYPVGYFSKIWASPPCSTFSNVRRSNIGRKIKKFGDVVVTAEMLDEDMRETGVKILNKTLEILDYFAPPGGWLLENPDTAKTKDFIHWLIPFKVVDYCCYSNYGYRKRTRIWYGGQCLGQFTPKRCRGKDKCPNMIEGTSHHKESVSGNTKRTALCDRYRVPERLIEDLLK